MKKYVLLSATSVVLSGCTNSMDQPPLVFARTQTFGATVGATAPDQGAQITVGFGDRNLAVVPTTTREGKEIRAIIKGSNEKGQITDTTDSLSVLGQFEAKAGNSTGVSLGTFFSTGQAASKLSDGFARRMQNEGGQTAHVAPPAGNGQ
jgi:hypothetical protein